MSATKLTKSQNDKVDQIKDFFLKDWQQLCADDPKTLAQFDVEPTTHFVVVSIRTQGGTFNERGGNFHITARGKVTVAQNYGLYGSRQNKESATAQWCKLNNWHNWTI